MIFLHFNGVSTSRAVRIYKVYGENAIETVRANPYTLAKDNPNPYRSPRWLLIRGVCRVLFVLVIARPVSQECEGLLPTFFPKPVDEIAAAVDL